MRQDGTPRHRDVGDADVRWPRHGTRRIGAMSISPSAAPPRRTSRCCCMSCSTGSRTSSPPSAHWPAACSGTARRSRFVARLPRPAARHGRYPRAAVARQLDRRALRRAGRCDAAVASRRGQRRDRPAGTRSLLTPNAAATLGLVFYELATNAIKYGACRPTAGRRVVALGRSAAGDHVELEWTKSGGPAVPAARSTNGFGPNFIDAQHRVRDAGQGRVGACARRPALDHRIPGRPEHAA